MKLLLVTLQLQGGGDMSLMTRFEHGAIRKGFILEEVSVRVLFSNERAILV